MPRIANISGRSRRLSLSRKRQSTTSAMTSQGYWVRFSRVPERSLNCHENGLLSALSRGFGRGFEGDLIAEAFKAALEIGNGAALTDLVEIGVSEIAIGHAPGEHVIGGHDNLVSNGQGGTRRAAPGLEAVEL